MIVGRYKGFRSLSQCEKNDAKMALKRSHNEAKMEAKSINGGGEERKGEDGESKGEKGRRKGMQGEKRNKEEVRGVKGGACPPIAAILFPMSFFASILDDIWATF